MMHKLVKIVKEEDVEKFDVRFSLRMLITEHSARLLIEVIADEVESYVEPDELVHKLGIRIPKTDKPLHIASGDELLIVAKEGVYQAFVE